ncbi:MAG: acyltransferase, partial [Candidatus Eremiobacteraeota bacterium]|nr:acyltransferase [Candidatus Eremiobacteraeota bacterium]
MGLVDTLFTAPGALLRALSAIVEDDRQRRRLSGVHFASGVIIRGADRIRVGRNVFLDHRAYLNCNPSPEGNSYITLGDNVEIGPYTVIWGGGGVEIGSNVHMGAHVHVTSIQGARIPVTRLDPAEGIEINRRPVKIGDHVLIFSGAVIVPGVTIGHHSMIAA